MVKMKAFRLPDPAWSLIGEYAKRWPPHPPARQGNVSVVLALLKDTTPETPEEKEFYNQMFGEKP